jgi:ribonuclease R
VPRRAPARRPKHGQRRKPPNNGHGKAAAENKRRRAAGRLPTREELLEFIAASAIPVGKRDIVRAFRVPPADRVALKALIREIERGGSVERGSKRRLQPIDSLPEIGVIEITEVDLDGEMRGKPLAWRDAEHAPTLYVVAERGAPALGVGERAVARFVRLDGDTY